MVRIRLDTGKPFGVHGVDNRVMGHWTTVAVETEVQCKKYWRCIFS